ncbi:MAG: shikimate dehydrogenase [Planctomycetaceae bacterium]
MICVSIGRTRHKMVTLEHQALAQKGAELVEYRLDYLSHMPDLGRLLKDRPTPVVITIRRAEDKGRWRDSEEQRQTLLRQAIVQGVEYVDLEMDIALQIRRYGKTKRIISYHNFRETPEDLADIHAKMTKLDPDIIKLATMANSPGDMVRMLQLVKHSGVPTAGFCMGEFGMASRVLCGKYGSPLSYATFNKDRELAPGQLSFDEMRQLFRFDQINADTQVFGVLGDPLAHSYSPLIHNAAFQHLGMNAVYVPFRVPKDKLTATLRDFDWLDVKGYSVTIPHKEDVIGKADHSDEAVQSIGAANTLWKDAGGQWHATNTDYLAALQTLSIGLGSEPDNHFVLAGKRVMMLGAGGVARAIGAGVVKNGGILMIASRTHARAKELAESLGCQHVLWENRGAQYADVLINCTPIGMHPNVEDTPFADNWLRDGMLVFDTIYNPENTLLIKQAKLRDCDTVSGLEMFIRQAAAQFELFTGQPAPIEQMRETLRRELSPVRLNP